MKNVLGIVVFMVVGSPVVVAQSASDATMQALLAEVRQLRLALERSSVAVPRIQLTLQRMQLQQDAAGRVSKELDDVRGQITRAGQEQTALGGEVKSLEQSVEQERDPARRKNLEDRLRTLKAVTEERMSTGSELRSREAELAGRLRTEQGKLDDLNQKLNALEAALGGSQ